MEYPIKNAIIIAGATKCGTTSLYNYLAQHPEIEPSRRKETRFFLDKEFPLDRTFYYEDGMKNYLKFFPNLTPNKWALEATPDYICSELAAKRISENIENPLIIFILRDPVERFISWFRFCKQNGILKSNITIEEYFQMQVLNPNPATPQHLRTLADGIYTPQIKRYVERFGNNVILINYAQFSVNTKACLEEILLAAKLDTSCIKNFSLKVENKTVSMKYPKMHASYKSTLKMARRKLAHTPLQPALKQLRKISDKIYFGINSKTLPEDPKNLYIPALLDFYRQENTSNILDLNFIRTDSSLDTY